MGGEAGDWGQLTRGTAGQLLGRTKGPSGPFLNRPFHTTPTPSTQETKEERGEAAKEKDECTINKT